MHHQRDRVSPVDFVLLLKLHHLVTIDDGTNSGSGDCSELIATQRPSAFESAQLRQGGNSCDRLRTLDLGKIGALPPPPRGRLLARVWTGGLDGYIHLLFTLLYFVCLAAYGDSVSLKLFPAHTSSDDFCPSPTRGALPVKPRGIRGDQPRSPHVFEQPWRQLGEETSRWW